MERGNVLVVGNSGVGKSTLINAVLGEERLETGYGIHGTTKDLKLCESKDESVPFRLIDTVGFEPAFFKELKAINAVKKWSRDCVKEGNEDNQINVIWFCVDGTSRKLFTKSIQNLLKATSVWKSVPIIVVITKSYSIPERAENIRMVQEAFDSQKKYSKNLKRIIPVVASTFELNETAFAPPEGIDDLIEATNELMPEGIKAGSNDLSLFKLNRKRAMAHGVVGIATTSAVVVGAVPIPIADALILSPLEVTEISSIAKIYGIKNDDKSKQLFSAIVEVGTVSAAAKAAISALKAIPVINLGASVINAIIAGSIVAALGEGTIYVFEQVHLGNKSLDDIDWVKKVLESKLSMEFIEKVKIILTEIGTNPDKKTIVKAILKLFTGSKK